MLIMALALSAMVQPDRWIHVGGSTNSYEAYFDKESVRTSGSRVTVWTRRDFVLDQSTVWHELELDCSTRTDTILAYVRDDRGTISHNDARPHREASPIQPGSIEDRIFDIVCR